MRHAWLCLLVACTGNAGFDRPNAGADAAMVATSDAAPPAPDPYDQLEDPLSPMFGFKTGADQLALVCARNNNDSISRAFCDPATPPAITSLVDLERLLGLDFTTTSTANAAGGNPGFVLTGHSSSLVARFVSAINPRAIIFTNPNLGGTPPARYVALGFVRGEQFVELVSNDPNTGDLVFFLFRFEQACNATAAGCSLDRLLTPKVERSFTSYSLYQDVDIKNTVFDCLQCHQTGGPGTTKALRMQELRPPWGHFFRGVPFETKTNGQVMLADYRLAHAETETYAGIPGAAIASSNPGILQGLVQKEGFVSQPNEFLSDALLDKGRTAAWQVLYDRAKTGQAIAPPYFQNRVTDPTKLASAAAKYKQAIATNTPLATDIRDVFAPGALRDLSFRPASDLVQSGDGHGILVQMCQQCHNPALDQTQSRARFDVTKLDTMPQAERDKAIHRLTLEPGAARKMPPTRFRELSPEEIQIATQALAQ